MRCLTICQPYASAIMAGIKRVENRDWERPLTYRGPLLIHAGKSREWLDSYNAAQEDAMRAACFKFRENDGFPELDTAALPFGLILGQVEVVDCLNLGDYLEKYGLDVWAFGDWCIRVENPIRFDRPIPWKGQLGLFDVPVSALEGQL